VVGEGCRQLEQVCRGMDGCTFPPGWSGRLGLLQSVHSASWLISNAVQLP